MKKRINNLTKYLVVIFVFSILSSCALKPIQSEFVYLYNDSNSVELSKLGNGKILIYNGADALHKIDNTARLNVWINDKALGQIRPSEYVIINLEKGQHTFKLLHIDLVNMRSEHYVSIDDETKIIKIKPTVTSNKLTVTNILPNNFDKFKFAEKR